MEKKQLNLSRQVPLDLARGLSVLFMVLVHIQEYFLDYDQASPLLTDLVDFLGGIPAAPVFMFLMGMGWVYSKKSTPKILLQRGLQLLATGYFLNLLRGVLPSLLNLLTTGDGYYRTDALQKLLYIDILQFAGLAMIAFAAIKKLNMSPKKIAGLALVIMATNAILAYGVGIITFDFGYLPTRIVPLILGHLQGLIYGANDFSYFPLLTWIIYPLLGYLFAYGLVRSKKLKGFYTISGTLGLVIFLAGTYLVDVLFQIDNQLYSYSGYYHHQAHENIIATGFVMFFIFLCCGLSKVMPSWLKNPIIRWSSNVTDIYFIHWVILGWLVTFMGYNTLSAPYYLALVVLIMWISDTMAYKRKSV